MATSPLNDATQELNRSVALLTTGLNQLKELLGSVGKQVAGLVKTFDPSAFRLFELAVADANAALGRLLLPTLRQFTAVVRGIGAGIASLDGNAQTMVRALAAAAVAMTAVAGAAFLANAVINSALGGIPAILGLVAGGLTGLGFALKGVAEVQATVNAVMRPLVALFNQVGAAVLAVFEAVRPTLTGLTQLAAGGIGQLAAVVRDATPKLVDMTKQFAGVLGQLAQHFAEILPLAVELAGSLAEIGQAVVSTQLSLLAAALSALLPLGRVFVEVLAAVMGVIAPLIRVALLPLQTMMTLLGAAIQLVMKVFDPFIAFVNEFGSLLGDLADLFADIVASLPALLTDVLPLFGSVVSGFTSGIKSLVKAIKDGMDVIRDLLGIPRRSGPPVESTFKPDAADGLGFRESKHSSIDEFIAQAQRAAFGIGKDADPAKKTATHAENIDNKMGELVGEIRRVREFAGKIYDRLPGQRDAEEAAGGFLGNLTGANILGRMITG